MRNDSWLNNSNIENIKNPFKPRPLSRFFFIGILFSFIVIAISMVISGFAQGIQKRPIKKSFYKEA